MNTRFLETLVWLTRLGSFSRTAEKLNTTQPAISARMNKLEELLGVPLYNHGERKFELTSAGRRILHHAEQIVTLSAAIQEIARVEEVIDAPISIGVIEMVTMSWLPQFINQVAIDLPTANVYIGTGTTRQLVQELREDRMNLIFVVGPLDEPNVVTRPVCTLDQAWTAHPSYFDCETQIDVFQLSRLPVVLPRIGSSNYDMLTEYFKTYGIFNLSHDRNLKIDCAYSLMTAIALVRTGLAIMPLPTVLFKDELAAGRLSRMNVHQSLPPVDIVAAWKSPLNNSLIHPLLETSTTAVGEFAGSCTARELWAA